MSATWQSRQRVLSFCCTPLSTFRRCTNSDGERERQHNDNLASGYGERERQHNDRTLVSGYGERQSVSTTTEHSSVATWADEWMIFCILAWKTSSEYTPAATGVEWQPSTRALSFLLTLSLSIATGHLFGSAAGIDEIAVILLALSLAITSDTPTKGRRGGAADTPTTTPD